MENKKKAVLDATQLTLVHGGRTCFYVRGGIMCQHHHHYHHYWL